MIYSVQAAIRIYHRPNGLNNTTLFPTNLEAGSTGSGYPHGQILVKALFLGIDYWFVRSILTCQKERWELSGVPFIRVLISFMRNPPSWPNYFSKTSPPNATTLRVESSKYEFGKRGKKKSTITRKFIINWKILYRWNMYSYIFFPYRISHKHEYKPLLQVLGPQSFSF